MSTKEMLLSTPDKPEVPKWTLLDVNGRTGAYKVTRLRLVRGFWYANRVRRDGQVNHNAHCFGGDKPVLMLEAEARRKVEFVEAEAEGRRRLAEAAKSGQMAREETAVVKAETAV